MVILQNTPIEKYNCNGHEVFVKREDLCADPPMPNFGKVRGIYELISKLHNTVSSIGVYDTTISQSGQAVAAVCKGYKLKCYCFVPGVCALSKTHLMALELGAEIVRIRANYTPICYQVAKTRMETEYHGYMVPFGVSCPEAVEAIAKEANTVPMEYLGGTIVLCSGSATTLTGILKGIKKPTLIVGISAGMSLKKQKQKIGVLGGIPLLPQIRLVESIMPYKQPCNISTPFSCNQYYDKKAWKWLSENIGSLKDPILFWNVGGEVDY